MSKERELLKRTIYFLEPLDWEAGVEQACQDLIREIEELLAQPEHLGGVTDMVERKQPLRELININKEWHQIGYEKAKQELKREPLSEEEIIKLWVNKSPINEFDCVRLVEKAHGIGDRDE